jgi:hypothetical protein
MRLSVDPRSQYFHRDALFTDVYVDGVRADNAVAADDEEHWAEINDMSYEIPDGTVAFRHRVHGHVEFRPRDERASPAVSYLIVEPPRRAAP